MASGRVLIVDDDHDLRAVLSGFLTDRQMETHQAGTGEEALALVREVRPHLVILDMHLPGMDGLETLKRVRELDSAAGIIIITGFDDPDLAHRAMTLGASDYVRKPIDYEYLGMSVMQKIHAMIGHRD